MPNMSSNKDRLYVALYARGGGRAPKMPGLEDKYHWALIIGPKTESGISRGRRFHAKEKLTFEGNPPTAKITWQYEELNIPMAPTSMIFVRVMIAKVKDLDRLKSIFETTQVRPEVEGWNCVGWVREAFHSALEDSGALGSSVSDWQHVRDRVMSYMAQKEASHRFDGKGEYDSDKVATWDMLANKETVS